MLQHRSSRGLYYDMRSGRSRTIKDEAMAELIIKMIASKLKAATLWSVRAIVHLFSATPAQSAAPSVRRSDLERLSCESLS